MIRLTRKQVREIDRLSIERYHIPGIVLMENAAIAVATAAIEMLGETSPRDLTVFCGGGNNGGDGLAVARHLHNRGANVSIFLTSDPNKYTNEAKSNWEIVQAMKLPVGEFQISNFKLRPSLIIDAIFGTGLSQAPREPFGEIVSAIEKIGAPVLAIDLPSGMDCDTGLPLGKCVVATRTVTFVAEKAGFGEPGAAKYLGRVIVGDIGCPRELIDEVRRF